MEMPLTVSETQETCVPESLARVIYGIEELAGVATRNQLIAGLFCVLMQECGYVLIQPIDCDGALEKNADLEGNEQRTMTFNFQRLLRDASLVSPLLVSSTGTYKLPLQLAGVENYQFNLLMTPTAEDLIIVNLLVTKDEFKECFSIALRVSTFVPKPKAENIADRFFDLKTLSIIFKDNIAHKGRSAVLNAEGIVNNSLIGLMDEVKQKIVVGLPITDLLNLSATCRSLLTIKQDVAIWRALLWRDFNYKASEEEADSVENLIIIYKQFQKQKPVPRTRHVGTTRSNFLYGHYDLDSDSDSTVVSRNASYNFAPYYITLENRCLPLTTSNYTCSENLDDMDVD